MGDTRPHLRVHLLSTKVLTLGNTEVKFIIFLLYVLFFFIAKRKKRASESRTEMYFCMTERTFFRASNGTKRKAIRGRIYLRKRQLPATAKNNSLIGKFLLNYFSSNRLLAFAVFLRKVFSNYIITKKNFPNPALPFAFSGKFYCEVLLLPVVCLYSSV